MVFLFCVKAEKAGNKMNLYEWLSICSFLFCRKVVFYLQMYKNKYKVAIL